MSEKLTIKNVRARRNAFVGMGSSPRVNEEENKNSSNNHFIATLIMNSNKSFKGDTHKKDDAIDSLGDLILQKNKERDDSLVSRQPPVTGMFSQPGSPVHKMDIPKTPIKIQNTINLFSPKNRQNTGMRENKLNSFVSNAPPSRRIRNFENSNQTTMMSSIRDNGNMTNERILSPTNRSKLTNATLNSHSMNRSGDAPSGRKYVANVIERELFRNTFMNLREKSDTDKQANQAPRYDNTASRRYQL
ncbi:unnamed protein product [Moneuplotes crassus]|uniref:Uncharacterized protein n=1 Tax=Euplotes crassus TaxID=5936 RepID=A0AAD1XEL2_EUPCR|nr:unnamed protein product [Moneuplotes crassus]